MNRRQEQAPLGWGPARRKLEIMLDKEWVGPLPIYSYLIEHPEGLFVVDTGDSARNSLKNYLPRTNPFFQYAVQIKVAPEEEIGVRLADMGIDPARDVRQLVMTHLHHDHTGGGSGCRQDPKARTRGRLMIRDARAAQTDQQSPHPTGGQLCPAATAGVSRRRPRSKIF